MNQSRNPAGTPAGGRWSLSERPEADITLDPGRGSATWPAVTVETRPWSTNPDQRGMSGARPSYADRMLGEIQVEIPASIVGSPVHLAPEVSARCEDAAARIATLESEGRHLAALGELLVRSEAVASSRIEHVHANLDDLARASIGESSSQRARSTLAAAQALGDLTASCNDGAPLTQDAVLSAHRALMGEDILERQYAGEYRTQQNWIGGSDFSPRDAVHVPPPAENVPDLMTDLVGFANRDDISAIAQAAIVHGQFEAIHPFTDGNGRIGRGLISAVLRRRGVTSTVVVPVAAAMLADVDTYFDRLTAYREGDVDAMVGYTADAAVAAAEASSISAARLADLPAQWREQVPGRRGSSARTLVEGLLDAPILDIDRATQVTGSTRQRTYDALDTLTDAEVLTEITGGGRNRIWVASDVMTEVEALEDRIGVRAKPSRRWR